MIAAIPFPEWINPEIIPKLPFRWYGMMYVVAITVVYLLFKYQIKQRKLKIDSDSIWSFFFWGVIGLILGARLFGTLVYDPSGYYWRQPWLIFWPFDPENGTFIGLRGMSYHGGLVGLIAGTLLYARYKKIDYLDWADMIVAAVPFGYIFGRLGNFINAELYGRVTTQPWGMIFPNADKTFSAKEPWVQEVAKATGVNIPNMNAMVNLPRHPSQLYEACLEGLVLGLIVWFWARKYHPFKGFTLGVYLIGYGAFRFFLEYFRAPDDWMGYIINFSGQRDLPLYIYKTPWAFSMGQILCFLMVVAGIITLLALKPRDERKNGTAAVEKSKNSARNLRKKLK